MDCLIHKGVECHDCALVFLSHSHDAMIAVNENGRIVVFNQAAEKMFGFSGDDVKNQKLSIIMPPDFGKRHDSLVRETFVGDKRKILGKTVEVTGWHQQKGEFPVELTLSKVEINNKFFILAVVRDISEKKDYIKRLQTKRSQLRKFNQSLESKLKAKEIELKELYAQRIKEEKLALLGKALSEVSHDVRGPLATISNSIYLLEATKSVKPEFEEYLQIMKSETDKVLQMMDGMRYFLRSKQPTLRRIRIENLLRDCPIYQELDKLNLIELDLRAEVVLADRIQLERVFANLLNNAAEAIKDVVMPSIKIISRREGSFTVVEVVDNGCGIKLEYQKNIFEPLFTTKSAGLGIGLASCQSIINNFGGEIGFESAVGKGTTFSIKLPAGRGEGDET